jgi:excisionase family DNA binding protein
MDDQRAFEEQKQVFIKRLMHTKQLLDEANRHMQELLLMYPLFLGGGNVRVHPYREEIASKHGNKDRLLSSKEAAEFLNVGRNTLDIWRCTKRHALPYVKVGRLVKYRMADIEKFLAESVIED